MEPRTKQVVNGAVIYDTRLRNGMTQRDLSRRCAELGGPAISESQLSKIERGHHRMRPKYLPALAKALGLRVDDLLIEEEAAA